MSRNSTLAALIFTLLTTSVAQAQADGAQLASQGKAIVEKQCARCHQIGLAGTSRLPIAPPFRELMQNYEPEALEEALGEGLASGHPDMPEFVFEPDEVAAIVAYFSTLRAAR